MKTIAIERNYKEALNCLEIVDNTNDFNITNTFEKVYASFIKLHKETNYKHIKNQKEFDGLVLSSTLQKINYKICDYCYSIVSNSTYMNNGYFACKKCASNR